MKAKKAVKKLTRVEAPLSNIVAQYAGHGHRVKELLDSAQESVIRAKATVNQQAASKDTKKPSAKAKNRLRRGHTPRK